ncbi:MAG: hypothetical protein ACE15C_04265 [Phycisphaerae bacterium]
MKRPLLLAVVLAAGAALLLPSPSISRAELKISGVTNLTQDQVPELVKMIEASSETWLKEGIEDKALKRVLPNVRYDETVLDALTAAMKTSRKDPANVYVINRLLAPIAPPMSNPPPMPWAKPEFCRKLLPVLRGLETPCGRYVEMPKYGKDSLARFQIPKDMAPGALSDRPVEVMRTLEAINKLRNEKTDKEMPLAQHNVEAARFQGYVYCVMAFANDPKEDDQLIRLVGSLESSGEATFTLVLAAIRREAPRMDASRAKKFYDELVKMADANVNGLPLKLQRKQYRDMTNIPLSPNDNTVPVLASLEPGAKMLDAANALAPQAKAAVVHVPTYQEISAAMDQKRKEDAAKPTARPTPRR